MSGGINAMGKNNEGKKKSDMDGLLQYMVISKRH